MNASFGNVFEQLEKKVRRAKKQLGARAQAQHILDEYLKGQRATVISVRTGEIKIEVTSAALFQEIEGFHREAIKQKLRDAGLKIHTVRAALGKD